MKAHDRALSDWYSKIQQGEIKLPRFQRYEAWDKGRIVSLLETVVNNLPLGVTLLLQVGDEEKFQSRHIATAEKDGDMVPNEHLLDGQQRLTAIWRTLHNNYETETYFVHFPNLSENPDRAKDEYDDNMIHVIYQSRWMRNDSRYPLWCDNAKETFSRGLIPVNLLSPIQDSKIAKDWIEAALVDKKPEQGEENYSGKLELYYNKKEEIFDLITEIREGIKHYNLPYLSLDSKTDKETALKVFINMNTNTKPLSLYDIIVAEIEMEKRSSLHDLQDMLDEKYPDIKHYYDLSYLLLYTSALLQDKLPNQKGLLNMNKSLVVENRGKVESGLNRMVKFLERQNIYDKQRLPTNAVLAVIAALYSIIPESGDKLGQDEVLLRKYLWSSFFTDRYENSAASRAYADFMGLKNILLENTKEDGSTYTEQDVPVFNREQFPLATTDALKMIGWPKGENIRGRGILAVAHILGASDFADGQQITREHLKQREYHHVYPYALLEKAGVNGDLALNCALITGKTNRTISDKDPMTYILDRYNWVSEDVVNQRLRSHLIPHDELKSGGYVGLSEEQTHAKIKSDFEIFIDTRAKYIKKAVDLLCEGKHISAHDIFGTEDKKKMTVEDIMGLLQKKEDETYNLEFKSTLRRSTKGNVVDKNLEGVIAKTVDAFMNTYGGTLIIGVTDDGHIYGLENDYQTLGKKNRDGFDLQLTQVLKDYIGPEWNSFFHIDYHSIDGKDICVIDIKKSPKPVYMKKEHKNSLFFVRVNGSSEPMYGESIYKYIENHRR